MWLLPSLGRPHLLRRFFKSYRATGCEGIGEVILAVWDSRLEEYYDIDLPAGWSRFISKARYNGPTLNEAFSRNREAAFYGLLNDDLMVRSPRLLQELAQTAGLDGVSYPNDGAHGEGLASFPCIGGNLARAVGYLAPEGFRHNGTDVIWMELARARGTLRYRKDLLLEHMHHYFGKGEEDSTYDWGAQGSQDTTPHYTRWKRDEFPRLAAMEI